MSIEKKMKVSHRLTLMWHFQTYTHKCTHNFVINGHVMFKQSNMSCANHGYFSARPEVLCLFYAILYQMNWEKKKKHKHTIRPGKKIRRHTLNTFIRTQLLMEGSSRTMRILPFLLRKDSFLFAVDNFRSFGCRSLSMYSLYSVLNLLIWHFYEPSFMKRSALH